MSASISDIISGANVLGKHYDNDPNSLNFNVNFVIQGILKNLAS